MVSDELLFKVNIDALLLDGADRRALGRQVLQRDLAANESRCDFSLKVDEPLHVASRHRVLAAGPVVPVDQGSRLGPRSRVSRLSAVVSPRLWAYVGQSAGEGRWPLCSVSGV